MHSVKLRHWTQEKLRRHVGGILNVHSIRVKSGRLYASVIRRPYIFDWCNSTHTPVGRYTQFMTLYMLQRNIPPVWRQ